ncbi:4'-phosphopantetheinyl transferase family protein [Curtobacterium sp. Leaf261]|uniref:4'-phosphopantetheinyl transferase family protein n=1 Tax=Curtobacterium sp. Leaf261 TaxID=1736311 RepID=UPI0006FB6C91|nr:4'-phosphopantetheinyl transferase superfamily protein [Curtobacterium sp. Leaf261]KQO64667.1 hypothetical protein ASF23_00160 [Curtobacterium sp. Leaf261]
MRAPRLQTVVVIRRRDSRTADHDRLRLLAAELADSSPDAVRLGQRCGHCGHDGHGPLTVSGTTVAVRVSLARSGEVVVLAATTGPVLGIDAEWVGRVAAAPLDAWSATERRFLGRTGGTTTPAPRAAGASGAGQMKVVRSDAETTATANRWGGAAAALWTAKEAVLKADGRGLRVDVRQVSVRYRGPTGRVRWAGRPRWARSLRIRRVELDVRERDEGALDGGPRDDGALDGGPLDDGALVIAIATAGRSDVLLRDERA